MNAKLQPERGSSAVETLRIPPHAIDAEQAVLGGLMLAPASLAKIADWLTEDDFYRRDHRLIWRAITELVKRDAPVDAVTLSDWFDANGLAELIGGSAYLIELANNTASAANIVAHAEIVVEKAKLRRAIDVGTKIVESAWGRHAEAQLVIAEASHELTAMQTSKLRGGLEPAKLALKELHAEIMARYQQGPGLLGLPTPWTDLNDTTKGLRDGCLYIVGARPSMGKTIFGLQIALNAALQSHRTAFFSVEMGRKEIMARAVACVGEIPHEWVEQPAMETPDADWYWSRLSMATTRINESPLLIDDTPALRIEQLMARVRRAHLQSPLRLIVIDHLHDMATDASREARFEYGRLTQGAKTLAKECGCPVVLLAQLNRGLANRQDKRPTMTDLRESGEIEQKADVILFLHREEYYIPSTHLRGIVEVIPAKGRNLRLGKTIYLQNTYSEMRLQDWIGDIPEPSVETHTPKRRISARSANSRFPENDR